MTRYYLATFKDGAQKAFIIDCQGADNLLNWMFENEMVNKDISIEEIGVNIFG